MLQDFCRYIRFQGVCRYTRLHDTLGFKVSVDILCFKVSVDTLGFKFSVDILGFKDKLRLEGTKVNRGCPSLTGKLLEATFTVPLMRKEWIYSVDEKNLNGWKKDEKNFFFN